MARALSKLSFELPKNFEPSEFDVVCSWARQNFSTAGNKRLRQIIAKNTLAYKNAKTKIDKGKIIDSIVNNVVEASPSKTGFVKHDKASCRWFFIGLDKAKDKVGHALRQATKDRSKPKSKKVADATSEKPSIRSKRALKASSSITIGRPKVTAEAYRTRQAHVHPYPHPAHHPIHHHHPSAYASWYASAPYPPPSMEYYRHHHHHAPPMEATTRHGHRPLPSTAPQRDVQLNHPGMNISNDTIHEHKPETNVLHTNDGRRPSSSSSSLPSLRHESPPHHHQHHHLPRHHHHHPPLSAPPSHPYPYNNNNVEYNNIMPRPSPSSTESSPTIIGAPPRGSPTSVIRETHQSNYTPEEDHYHHPHHHGVHPGGRLVDEDAKFYHNAATPIPSPSHGHVAPHPPYSYQYTHPAPTAAPATPASPPPSHHLGRIVEPTSVEDAFGEDDNNDGSGSHHHRASSPLSKDCTSSPPLEDMNSQYKYGSQHYFHHHHSYSNAHATV